MPFRVEVTSRAQRDLVHIFDYVDAENSTAAAHWYNGLEELILSLRDLPERGTVTAYDPTLRFLSYGNKPRIYLVLYRVFASDRRVSVRHVRHRARDRPQRV